MKPTGMFERVRFLESRLDRLEDIILAQDQQIRDLQRGFAVTAASPEFAAPGMRGMIEIAASVAADNGLTLAELRGDIRAFEVSRPRQYAMKLMADAGHSQSAIGRFFGRDHTTVMHGIRAAKARAKA